MAHTTQEQGTDWPPDWQEFDADVSTPMTIESLAAEQRAFQAAHRRAAASKTLRGYYQRIAYWITPTRIHRTKRTKR